MTEMSSSQCQWTNERALEFLELYQSEPLLWNPMIRDHKNRNAVADAWERIRNNFTMSCTITELTKRILNVNLSTVSEENSGFCSI